MDKLIYSRTPLLKQIPGDGRNVFVLSGIRINRNGSHAFFDKIYVRIIRRFVLKVLLY